jgi:hypothetical protein
VANAAIRRLAKGGSPSRQVLTSRCFGRALQACVDIDNYGFGILDARHMPRRVCQSPPSLSFSGAAPSGRIGADGRRWSSRHDKRINAEIYYPAYLYDSFIFNAKGVPAVARIISVPPKRSGKSCRKRRRGNISVAHRSPEDDALPLILIFTANRRLFKHCNERAGHGR